ncbi:thioesterase II family protein [Streptomyces sp. TLI_146]|uniref:thioesterase II family protein n=1 Tax=Streptomyces sp. TLI_146 TaxID=1938858 RepID=UPI000C70A754|nr:alpha/beta fold hydrolase [Streptomyces sp. TLI_146]PKV84109.1 medium-chain acyl-[acyl-carrier-protein] hydrolase/pyochelin biosynthetic protein PchC [Streptomyces sp. TLI_146]
MTAAFLRVGPSDASTRLLAFHHAGGSATAYLPFVRGLSDETESLLFQLPGRDEGEEDLRPADFEDAVERLARDFHAAVDRPCVVFGHSLGGLLAHRLVGTLPEDRRALVRTVVVSASASPRRAADAATTPAAPFVSRTRASVLDDLRRFGGCPPELFEDPELVEHFVDVLGHDLHLADTYTPGGGDHRGVPYEVWYGTEDETTAPDGLSDWADCGPDPVVVRGFPGGHFYLFERPDAGSALRELLHKAAAPHSCASAAAATEGER